MKTPKQRASIYRKAAEMVAERNLFLCPTLRDIGLDYFDRPEFRLIHHSQSLLNWYYHFNNSIKTQNLRITAMLFCEQMALDKKFQRFINKEIKEGRL